MRPPTGKSHTTGLTPLPTSSEGNLPLRWTPQSQRHWLRKPAHSELTGSVCCCRLLYDYMGLFPGADSFRSYVGMTWPCPRGSPQLNGAQWMHELRNIWPNVVMEIWEAWMTRKTNDCVRVYAMLGPQRNIEHRIMTNKMTTKLSSLAVTSL